jgi:hypothetical protein
MESLYGVSSRSPAVAPPPTSASVPPPYRAKRTMATAPPASTSGGAQLVSGSSPLGYIAVGATRAASVVWRGGTAAEIDFAAQAAAAESRIIIGVGSDGEILIGDVSVEA